MKKDPTPLSSRIQDSLDLYWDDIKHSEPLSRRREVELFRRLKSGDEQARDLLVQANLRFVVSVAREYKECGVPMAELISEGNVGLLEAVKRFDETRGFKFITYAVWWIRQAIFKTLAEQGRIARPPMSQLTDLKKVEKHSGILAQRLGRTPTFEEIVSDIEISRERTKNALEVSQQDLSLDAPVFAEDEMTLIDLQPSGDDPVDESYVKAEMTDAVQGCLEVLDRREYEIVRAYFGLEGTAPLTLEEIGDSLGVTRERVRQLRNRALEKMLGHCAEQLLPFSEN